MPFPPLIPAQLRNDGPGVDLGLRARWLLDAMSGLVGLLSPHGNVLELNGVGLACASLSRTEACGRKLWELPRWYRSDGARRRMQRAVTHAARGTTTRLELSLHTPAGELRTFDILLTPLRDLHGHVALLLLEGSDMTDPRGAQGALVRHNAELQELADRLGEADARRRRFVTDIGHELKTPLGITIGLLDRVLGDSVLPAAARRDVVMARRHAQSMQVQVDQLLTAARIEAGRLELRPVPCDLSEIARQVAAGFESVAVAQGVNLEVRAPRSVVVIADPQRVASAITNLVSNALKSTLATGSVRIELRELPRGACLEVADSGPGVPARLRDAVFERFRQGSAPRLGGSGIGLALVNEIMTMHGGSISIDKAPEGGALFRLEFKVAPAGATAAPLPDIGAAIVPSRERLRGELSRRGSGEPRADDADERPAVLVVTQDIQLAERLVRHLSKHYRVRHVGRGEQALHEIQRRPPELVLADVGRRGRSGEALVETLRSSPEHDHLPIVALSGESDRTLGERLLRAGASDFVSQSVSDGELSARIDGIVMRRAQQRRIRETAALAEASFEHAALGIGIVGPDGRWLLVNGALCSMLLYSRRELRQMTLDEVTVPEDVGIERAHLEDAIAGRARGFQVEKRLRRADGTCIWAVLSVAVIGSGDDGRRLVVHADDIGERRAQEDRLRRLAVNDELTQLPRRREFERRLRRRLRALHGPAALVVVQIDRLEAINRRRGRAAGDAVLRAAARAVVEAAPRGALTGRIGGDRLAVLLTRTSRDAAMARATAIGEAVHGCDVRAGAVRVRVTASVGTAMLRPGADVDAALDAAENALARAKRATGGRVELISNSHTAATAGRRDR